MPAPTSEPGEPGEPETAELTVVVATRNRREQLLDSLPRHRAPVILVDNGSDDGTPDAVEAHHPQVTVVRLPDNRGAAGRNVGVELARTPYVAFADDDSWWAPGSLAGAVGLLRRHPRLGLLAARVLVGAQQRLDPASAAMAASPLGTPAGLPGPAVLGFLACSVALRRDAFLAAGGFEPVLHVYGEEDLLALDLVAAGWGLSYVEELVVHHVPAAGRSNVAARQQIQARNRLLTALLRRPAGVVLETALAVAREPGGPGGLADAARLLPWALRHRRRLPAGLERDRRRLDRAATGSRSRRPGFAPVGPGRSQAS